MSNLARQEMYFDHFYGLDELIEKIEAVTAEELLELANHFFQTDSVAVTILGNSSTVFFHDLSYSKTLKALLPARAPPRL